MQQAFRKQGDVAIIVYCGKNVEVRTSMLGLEPRFEIRVVLLLTC